MISIHLEKISLPSPHRIMVKGYKTEIRTENFSTSFSRVYEEQERQLQKLLSQSAQSPHSLPTLILFRGCTSPSMASPKLLLLKYRGLLQVIRSNLILFQKPQRSLGINITLKLRGGAGIIR